MITVGSIPRESEAARFPLLAPRFRGRRNALKDFTHRAPDFVFWIHPDGTLFDARDAHRSNVPRGFDYILEDEPDHGGFLRGRIATSIAGHQLIVVYCRSESLAASAEKISQLLAGLQQVPVPIQTDALVISDNADMYGTLQDLTLRFGRIARVG